jgi:hypothetical protein
MDTVTLNNEVEMPIEASLASSRTPVWPSTTRDPAVINRLSRVRLDG